MKNLIDQIFIQLDENNTQKDPDVLIDLIRTVGTDLLNDSRSIQPKYVNQIAERIPFSYQWIEKIVDSEELTIHFWNNSAFEKETIEDLGIVRKLYAKKLLDPNLISNGLINFCLSIENDVVEESLRPLFLEIKIDSDLSNNQLSTFLINEYFKDLSKVNIDWFIRQFNRVDISRFDQNLIVEAISLKCQDNDYWLLSLFVDRPDLILKVFKKLNGDFRKEFSTRMITGESSSYSVSAEKNPEIVKELIKDLDETILGLVLGTKPTPFLAKLIWEETKFDVLSKVPLFKWVEAVSRSVISADFLPHVFDSIVKEQKRQTPLVNNYSLSSMIDDMLSSGVDKEALEGFLIIIEDYVLLQNFNNKNYLSFKTAQAFPRFAKYLEPITVNLDLASVDQLGSFEIIEAMVICEDKDFDLFLKRAIDLELDNSYVLSRFDNLARMNQFKQGQILDSLKLEDISSITNFNKLSEDQILELLSAKFENASLIKMACPNPKLFSKILTLIPENLKVGFVRYNLKFIEELGVDSFSEWFKKNPIDANFMKGLPSFLVHNFIENKWVDSSVLNSVIFSSLSSLLDSTYLLIAKEEDLWNQLSDMSKSCFKRKLLLLEENGLDQRVIEVLKILTGDDFFSYQTSKSSKWFSQNKYPINFTGAVDWSLIDLEDFPYWISISHNQSEAYKEIDTVEKFNYLYERFVPKDLDWLLSKNISLCESLIEKGSESQRSFVLETLAQNGKSFSGRIIDSICKLDSIESIFTKYIINIDTSYVPKFLTSYKVDFDKVIESLIDKETADVFFEKIQRNEQYTVRAVRSLRKLGKESLIPEEYQSRFDVFKEGMSFDFYQIESFAGLSQDQINQLADLINNSDFSNITKISREVFLKIKLKPQLLLKASAVFSSSILEQVEESVNFDNFNKHIEDLMIINLESNQGRAYFDDRVYFFLKKRPQFSGLKKYIDLIEIGYSFLIQVEKHSNQQMIESLIKRWRSHKAGSGINDLPISIRKEMVNSVSISEVNLENIEFYENSAVFRIANLKMGEIAFNKKTKKFKIILEFRPEITQAMVSIFKEVKSNYPYRIEGLIDIEGEFIPKEEKYDHLTFKVSEEDKQEFIDMKNLGVESGLIKAEAIRSDDLTYKVKVLFEKEAMIDPNEINHLIKAKTFDLQKKLDEILKVSPDRNFGFELELGVIGASREEIAKSIKKLGFKVAVSHSYGKSSGKTWDFKEDGSLEDHAIENYNEDTDDYEKDGDVFEIASPILKGREGIKEAELFLNKLNSFDTVSGQDVNAGLHVHHDINDFKEITDYLGDVVKHFVPFQKALYELVDDWRQDNSYCAKISSEDLDVGRNVGGINATGIIITSFGTLEFRMKEGTTNTKEILRWIIYTQKIVETMYWKVINDSKNLNKQLESVNQATFYMILENKGYRSDSKFSRKKNILENARKIVGIQGVLNG